MPFDFLFRPAPVDIPSHSLTIGARTIPVHFIRNHKARRYILRVQADGSLRVTVPRVGTGKAAQAFVDRSREWIAKQLQKQQQQPARPQMWQSGTAILFRGETIILQVVPTRTGHSVTIGDQTVPVAPRCRPASRRGTTFVAIGSTGITETNPRTGPDPQCQRPPDHRSQPADPLGILFTQGDYFLKLATDSKSGFCPGVHHPA